MLKGKEKLATDLRILGSTNESLWNDFKNCQAKLDKSCAKNEALSALNTEKCEYIELLENQKSELGHTLDQTKHKVEEYEHNEKLLKSRIDVLISENMKFQSMIEGEKYQNENKGSENGNETGEKQNEAGENKHQKGF